IDHAYLQTFLRVTVPNGWPADELKSHLPFYIEEIERDPSIFGWGVWILLNEVRKVIIGDVGFKGKPDEHGIIEIGYSIHPDYRNCGYAFEAVRALMEWAFQDGSMARIIRAECHKNNHSSINV